MLRQQLPLKNAFYPEDAPSYDDPIEVEKFSKKYPSPNMCVVCGYPGPNRCAKCKKTFYCSREHQLAHWKGGHKKRCNIEKGDLESAELLFDEYELVSEEFDDEQLTGGKEFEEDDGDEIFDPQSAQEEAGNFFILCFINLYSILYSEVNGSLLLSRESRANF